MGDVVPLHPPRVDSELVDAIERLRRDAIRDDLIGMAFVVVYRDRTYQINVVGETRKDLRLGKRMVRELYDELMRLSIRQPPPP